LLEIVGLAKSFAGRPVLSGLDLSVGAGECLALLGGNGSGKTTTLNSIVGLTLPDTGEIRVNGIDVLRDPKSARRRLSFLPQKSVFPAALTAREAVQVVARLRGLPDSRVEEELDGCGLAPMAGRSVAVLSGGERQRLGLAIAFLPDAAVYLFDEPTANLDPEALSIFFRRVGRLRREGKAILFATHVRADVDALATRTLVLSGGKVAEGDARFLESRFRLAGGRKAFGDSERDRPLRGRLAVAAPRGLR
jgi:ABC-2 type transport system ATP-binding protein